jgi:hypothetical protein
MVKIDVSDEMKTVRGEWKGKHAIIIIIIIIISAERRPLLDIGLPQSSPRRSVLCLPVRGRHSRTFPPQRPSCYHAMLTPNKLGHRNEEK